LWRHRPQPKPCIAEFQGRGNGSSPAPAVSQPKKSSNWTSAPATDFQHHRHILRIVGVTSHHPARQPICICTLIQRLGAKVACSAGSSQSAGHNGSLIPSNHRRVGLDGPRTRSAISSILVGLRSLGTLWWISSICLLFVLEYCFFSSSPLVLRGSKGGLRTRIRWANCIPTQFSTGILIQIVPPI
jgi:hypothetical protein